MRIACGSQIGSCFNGLLPGFNGEAIDRFARHRASENEVMYTEDSPGCSQDKVTMMTVGLIWLQLIANNTAVPVAIGTSMVDHSMLNPSWTRHLKSETKVGKYNVELMVQCPRETL